MPHLPLDDYIVDALMPDLVGHDRHPSAFLVYLFLWRRSAGSGSPTVQLALRDIADATGLSKRAVQGALRRLSRRRLLHVSRAGITAVPIYRVCQPWER